MASDGLFGHSADFFGPKVLFGLQRPFWPSEAFLAFGGLFGLQQPFQTLAAFFGLKVLFRL